LVVVAEERAVLAVRAIEVFGGVAVIDRQHGAARHHLCHLRHPIDRVEIDFSPIAVRQVDPALSQVGGEFIGEGAVDLAESLVAIFDIDLLRPAVEHCEPVNRKGIHEFIRKKESGDAVRRQIFQAVEPGNATGLSHPGRQIVLLLGAHCGAALDQDVSKTVAEVRGRVPASGQEIPRQQSLARSHLHHREGVWMPEERVELLCLSG
jgi:hypothetical protein